MLNACIRCSTIFVGLVSLIQAIIWAGFSIWFIAMYSCAADPVFLQTEISNPHDISSSYLFYLSYIRGECRNPNIHYVAPSAQRTYIYFLVYSIISSIWVPTTVLLLVGTCLGARGVKVKWIYSPYIIVTIGCCIIDVVATVNYAMDISKTMTVADYINFIEISPSEQIALGITSTAFMNGKTAGPAIVMTILASRCVILWLLNAFFIAFGLQGLCAFSKPGKPKPYNQSPQYLTDQQNQEGKQIDGGWIPFTKQNQSNNANNKSLYPNLNDPHYYDSLPKDQRDYNRQALGRSNPAYEIDGPLRLDPIEVEVKQERANHFKDTRYAEIAEIEMEPTPEEIRHTLPKVVQFIREDSIESGENDVQSKSDFDSKLEKFERLGLVVPTTIPKESNISNKYNKGMDGAPEEIQEEQGNIKYFTHISVAESAMENKDDVLDDTNPAPIAEDNQSSEDTPRRVFDVHGNPTEERLTPKIARIQKIIEKQMTARYGDLSGVNNNKPYSYVQPLQPQLDSLPKKNDTVRGIEKPPIPVPDYSVRVNKTPSFRAPLNNTTN